MADIDSFLDAPEYLFDVPEDEGNNIMHPSGRDKFRAQQDDYEEPAAISAEEFSETQTEPALDAEARRQYVVNIVANVLEVHNVSELIAEAQTLEAWLRDGTPPVAPDSPPQGSPEDAGASQVREGEPGVEAVSEAEKG